MRELRAGPACPASRTRDPKRAGKAEARAGDRPEDHAAGRPPARPGRTSTATGRASMPYRRKLATGIMGSMIPRRIGKAAIRRSPSPIVSRNDRRFKLSGRSQPTADRPARGSRASSVDARGFWLFTVKPSVPISARLRSYGSSSPATGMVSPRPAAKRLRMRTPVVRPRYRHRPWWCRRHRQLIRRGVRQVGHRAGRTRPSGRSGTTPRRYNLL